MIGDITESSGQISVGAGVTIAELAEVAHRHGWDYGIDLSSRTTATVGGTIATNAGGNNVAFYGDTRAQVAGIEAVLGTAEIVSHMSGLIKDNTGFALAPLFCGSEGTLGIVTAARLRLIVPPRFRATALLGFDNVTDLFACAANLRRQLGNVMSAEYLLDKGMSAAVNRFKVTPPFRENAYLVVEVGGNGSQLERLAHAVSSLGTVKNDAITEDPTRRGQLWQFRNGQSDALLAIGTPLKFDVTIPFPKIEETCARIEERISAQWPTAESYFFGHALDGNIHINILFATEYEKEISDLVLQRVAETGGAISAEHGIGRAKVDYLHLARSESEIELFHRIKQACDPDGILNPGVLLKSR
jgi:FAD/FMN-containing dehydrogenase